MRTLIFAEANLRKVWDEFSSGFAVNITLHFITLHYRFLTWPK